jgi:hypothetical protein
MKTARPFLSTFVRPALGAALLFAAVLAPAAPARAQSEPRIRSEFRDGVLHVNVSDLPPGAAVEVKVTDTTHNHDESPNGTPPRTADDGGAWPGRDGGDIVGYPGTGEDDGGTEYRVCVIVNGESGPCDSIEKDTTFLDDVLEVINVLKHVGKLFRWLFA